MGFWLAVCNVWRADTDDQAGVMVRLGIDVGECTTGFTGTTLRFGVFGNAVVCARQAASASNPNELVVTDNVAAHCSLALQATSDGLHIVTGMVFDHPTTTCHPRWLWFENPTLERRFVHHHNRMCMVPELFWMMLGLLSVVAYARDLDAGAPALTVAAVLWVAVEAVTLALVTLCRAWFLRYDTVSERVCQ